MKTPGLTTRNSYRLVLEYDGTAYVGWQRQTSGASIQAVLEGVLRRVLGGERVSVIGSGRTDSGVHALAQVASFSAATRREPPALRMGLNSLLPRDIACRSAEVVEGGFDASRGVRSKLYRYRIVDTGERSPLRDRWVWHLRGPLDVVAMNEAASHLVGFHDFTSFRAAGSSARTSTRTLLSLKVTRDFDEVVFEVEGEGFLRHMVRIIVGTLVDVGRSRLTPNGVGEILLARNRTMAGKTAPARGLCLVRVVYESGWSSEPVWVGSRVE